MSTRKTAVSESFYQELIRHMENGEELSVRAIYSLFPEINPNTLSWRLHMFVKEGKLRKSGQGYYTLLENDGHYGPGYDYLQSISRKVYDIAVDYGYDFYITGIDSLIGDLLHIPEKYPVLIVIEDNGVKDIQDALVMNDLLVLTEKEQRTIGQSAMISKIDVFILKGRDFSLAVDHIAQKEKGFVDLYYAVTRMEYGISIPELSRIYQNLQRNRSIAALKIINAARDRGVNSEINWLMDLNKTPKKAREFMGYQITGV